MDTFVTLHAPCSWQWFPVTWHCALSPKLQAPIVQQPSHACQQWNCLDPFGPDCAAANTRMQTVILTGEILPDAGDARIAGHSILLALQQARQRLGYCPQRSGSRLYGKSAAGQAAAGRSGSKFHARSAASKADAGPATNECGLAQQHWLASDTCPQSTNGDGLAVFLCCDRKESCSKLHAGPAGGQGCWGDRALVWVLCVSGERRETPFLLVLQQARQVLGCSAGPAASQAAAGVLLYGLEGLAVSGRKQSVPEAALSASPPGMAFCCQDNSFDPGCLVHMEEWCQ
eukprot:159377-Pelagomonas_calceolata.AAC.2